MRTKTYSLIAATLLSAASLSVAEAPVTVACPSDFHKLTVPSDAKQCQQFDATLPATLVFYSSTPRIREWQSLPLCRVVPYLPPIMTLYG